ncbi:MAG: hypothetical protein JZL64_00065, partial [Ferrovum myxofaciens]|nr:hypothetical protein [Ferrovum myxofaciens]
FAEFDDGTHILEDHITGRALGQAVRDLLTDDLVLRWIQPSASLQGRVMVSTGSLDSSKNSPSSAGRGWLGGFVSGMSSNGLGVRGQEAEYCLPHPGH